MCTERVIFQLCLLNFWREAEAFRVSAGTGMSVTSMDKGQVSALSKMVEQDAVNLFSKYIAKDANQSIGVSPALHEKVVKAICGEDRRVAPDAFVPAQAHAVELMERRFFPEFLASVDFARHQLAVLRAGRLSLEDILFADPAQPTTALPAFVEFLDGQAEGRRGRGLVEFCLAAESWRADEVRRRTAEEWQDDAMLLYDKYFSLQAPNGGLGLGERARREVESGICREGGPLPDCFDSVLRTVFSVLQQVSPNPFT